MSWHSRVRAEGGGAMWHLDPNCNSNCFQMLSVIIRNITYFETHFQPWCNHPLLSYLLCNTYNVTQYVIKYFWYKDQRKVFSSETNLEMIDTFALMFSFFAVFRRAMSSRLVSSPSFHSRKQVSENSICFVCVYYNDR